MNPVVGGLRYSQWYDHPHFDLRRLPMKARRRYRRLRRRVMRRYFNTWR